MFRTVHVLERALQAPGCTPGPWLALLMSHPLTQGLALSPEPDGRRRAAVSRGRGGEIDPAPLTTQAHAHRARRGDRALCQGHPGVGPHGQGHRLRHLPLPLTLTLALTLTLTLTLTRSELAAELDEHLGRALSAARAALRADWEAAREAKRASTG